jgi:membrane protein DedA with SNARE-associated domain
VVPAAALAAIPFPMFLAGIIVGNGVFVTAHYAAGFLLGGYAREFIQRVSDPMVILVGLLVVLGAVGLIVLWRRSRRTATTDTYECWADCSCPACVAVVALGPAARSSAGT